MNKLVKYGAVVLITASMAFIAASAFATTTPGSMMPGDAAKNEHGMTSAEREGKKVEMKAKKAAMKAEHDKMMADHKVKQEALKQCVVGNQTTRQTYRDSVKINDKTYKNALKTARQTRETAVKKAND